MTSAPASDAQRVICNPLDLAYRYQDVRFKGSVNGIVLGEPRRSVHREAADPSIVRYRGRYYLFASMSAGFWHSTDLARWDYTPTHKLPAFDYAPDVREVDGVLLISASRKQESPFYRSVDPLADDFVQVSPGPFPFWDPNVFQDDDGETYLYWGCDNSAPIEGVKLDTDTFTAAGAPVALIGSDVDSRGWERRGDDHVIPPPRTEQERIIAQFTGDSPYIEGAWMTKRAGVYYLQYAAPGTQYNTYADGYFTAPSPLGPFEYSPHSPFSAKPGGFITGAGHGSTFQDEYGNWWHAATMRISVNDVFERRIGLFPAGFDDEGVLFCNQSFGDYPLVVPEGPADPWAPPQWMLLSYRSATQASSSADGHGPDRAVDEDIRTWWTAATTQPGEHLTVDLGEVMTVSAVQINLADHNVAELASHVPDGADGPHTWRGIYREDQRAELFTEVSTDGRSWHAILDTRKSGDDRPHAFVLLDEPRRVRYVRVTAGRLPFGSAFAVSGIRVFGRGNGEPPAPVAATGTRTGSRSAQIRWGAVDHADGYVVRYGLYPDRLYHSWMLYERTELDLRALNAGVPYWVAVDSFNENGVTTGNAVPVQQGQASPPPGHGMDASASDR